MLTLTLPVERLPPPPRRYSPWLRWAALLVVAALAWMLSGCRIEPLAACTGSGCDDTPPPAPQVPRKAPRKPAKPVETPSPTRGTPHPRKAYAGRSVRIWGAKGGMQAGAL